MAKNNIEVFTPNEIVKIMLNEVGYTKQEDILYKHIIDNSCGDGNFLVEIVERYISAYKQKYKSISGIKEHLQKFIHGIEINCDSYTKCINRLDNLVFSHGLKGIKWDILNADTLTVVKFNKKMDYVIGNPPYLRLDFFGDKYKIKKMGFGTIRDLYFIFYKSGVDMLTKGGKLCYITPASWETHNIGKNLRKYLTHNCYFEKIISFENNIFLNANIHVRCYILNKAKQFDYVTHKTYKPYETVLNKIPYNELFVNDLIILSNHDVVRKVLNYSGITYVKGSKHRDGDIYMSSISKNHVKVYCDPEGRHKTTDIGIRTTESLDTINEIINHDDYYKFCDACGGTFCNGYIQMPVYFVIQFLNYKINEKIIRLSISIS